MIELLVKTGALDLAAAADSLAARLPEPLKPLAAIAYNYLWSWTPGGHELFADLDQQRWALCARNPVRILHEVSQPRLGHLAVDPGFLNRMRKLADGLAEELQRPVMGGSVTAARPAAFLCAEYAVHPSLPVYSGGLGVLAGDILKAASDMGLPLVAVGMMYRHGYFRQRTDATGWQHEYWVDTDPDLVPGALVTGEDGHPLTVRVPVGDREVVCQIWRVAVGRVPLLLLDTNRPENNHSDRFITSRLYVGDPEIRLDQYSVLGIGGIRALETLGVNPEVVHLNEGHAAFAVLELARAERDRNGLSFAEAFEAARSAVVFTTHTPVPAGNDTYPAAQVANQLAGIAAQLGTGVEELVARGLTHPRASGEPFGMTQFALRTSRCANGVAVRHGKVAREMWRELWPGVESDDVPIGSVTNGAHIPTWLGEPMWALFDRYLPNGWLRDCANPKVWEAVERIPDEELWAARHRQRAALVRMVADRSATERLNRGEPRSYMHAAADTLSPDVLTVGFARRLATYKRLNLLLCDLDRMRAIMGNTERPVQLLIAGKAHPNDAPAKALLAGLFEHRYLPEFAGRLVFLDDYDMNLAAAMVRGCDVWVNLPRPPLEASGTSGMKSSFNGGLQLSVLDGWWPECYDGANGWAISGEIDADHDGQDGRHADAFYELLSQHAVPSYYEREDGLPRRWLGMVRRSLMTAAPRFSATRMVADYATRIYTGAVAERLPL